MSEILSHVVVAEPESTFESRNEDKQQNDGLCDGTESRLVVVDEFTRTSEQTKQLTNKCGKQRRKNQSSHHLAKTKF